MTEENRCDICWLDVDKNNLISDGICTLRMCRSCYLKTGGDTCPQCGVLYAWAESRIETGTQMLEELSLLSDIVFGYMQPPAPRAPLCLHKGCIYTQILGELCEFHCNDTGCNKIIERGIKRTRCGNRANKGNYCKHHVDSTPVP